MSPNNSGNVADLDVARLMRQAGKGDTGAWEQLVERYGRLIWSITRDFRLRDCDAADVFQTTWMRLVEHIDRIEQADRVGSWLAVTARRECLRCIAARNRVLLAAESDHLLDEYVDQGPGIDEALLAGERAQLVREALTQLPSRWQRLMDLLMADPPIPYTEIAEKLGLPIGSIGPTRGRCLARLRVLLETA